MTEHYTNRINRIRLEFKDLMLAPSFPCLTVLIESDWNLKFTTILALSLVTCINRIRLEFKVNANAMMDQSNAY